jgi:hypothetical protein
MSYEEVLRIPGFTWSKLRPFLPGDIRVQGATSSSSGSLEGIEYNHISVFFDIMGRLAQVGADYDYPAGPIPYADVCMRIYEQRLLNLERRYGTLEPQDPFPPDQYIVVSTRRIPVGASTYRYYQPDLQKLKGTNKFMDPRFPAYRLIEADAVGSFPSGEVQLRVRASALGGKGCHFQFILIRPGFVFPTPEENPNSGDRRL